MGMVRVPFLVPHVGERAAELLKMPFMFIVNVLSARVVDRRLVHRRRRQAESFSGCGRARPVRIFAIPSVRPSVRSHDCRKKV